MFTLLALPLRTRRDAVLARQRGRRLAALLQYGPHEQTLVGAGTFAVASQALEILGQADLCFQVDRKTLHVFAQPARPVSRSNNRLCKAPQPAAVLLRLARALPEQREFSEADLRWIVDQLPLLEPVNLYEEMRRQNQEMLGLLHALHSAQAAHHLCNHTAA
jgi:hypothetical protein